jgi:hypothetical protein
MKTTKQQDGRDLDEMQTGCMANKNSSHHRLSRKVRLVVSYCLVCILKIT